VRDLEALLLKRFSRSTFQLKMILLPHHLGLYYPTTLAYITPPPWLIFPQHLGLYYPTTLAYISPAPWLILTHHLGLYWYWLVLKATWWFCFRSWNGKYYRG